MNETITIKRGSELELDIESLAYGGMGLARKETLYQTQVQNHVLW
jgi:hypothetical protein